MASSSLSNISLNYINYPTKVVFRSCKLIPTMALATIINRQRFALIEYFSAGCICAGLILFASADWKLGGPNFSPLGYTFVFLSVCADSITPNAQERLFKAGSTRLEVTFYTNIMVLGVMTVSTLMSGDLIGCLKFVVQDKVGAILLLTYTLLAYVAISIHMHVVKRFGGVAAVILGTLRKAMTILLSFLVFPKKFDWYYVVGSGLVLGGLLLASVFKKKGGGFGQSHKRSRSDMSKTPSQA
ncbi:hypothetical protein ScalyP_jg10670 [Parmales sp. scaly parma]|nr:hypothetical protein ScalyP_jg10670 [Parmales sp. scaly parma]